MKQILFLLLFPVLAQAQTVATDTSFIRNVSGEFFETRIITYKNGESSNVVKLVGDTAAVQNLYVNAANTASKQIAANVAKVLGWKQVNQTISRLNKTSQVFTGKGVFDVLQARHEADWVDTSALKKKPVLLTFTDASGARPATVTKGANNLQIKIGADNLRTFQIFGTGAVRILSYPTSGENIVLYNLDNKNFSNIDGSVSMQREDPVKY